MNQSFEQSVTFKLDKAHLQECFEQSAPAVTRKDYVRAAILAVIGMALFFVEAEHYYLPFFIFCLGVVEILSVKYRKTWWVWRQLMSKAANAPVKLIFNQQGITTTSKAVNSQINWEDVTLVERTEKGLLVKHNAGTNYLSYSYLSDSLIEFILSKAKTN